MLKKPLSLKLSWEHGNIWVMFRVMAKHLPQWGKKNPFPSHHLAREKFTQSAAALTYVVHNGTGWAVLSPLSKWGLSRHRPPPWGPHRRHSKRELDVASGCKKDIRFGHPLYRKCTRDKSPPRPAGALRDALCAAGKESDSGVQQVYVLNGKKKVW